MKKLSAIVPLVSLPIIITVSSFFVDAAKLSILSVLLSLIIIYALFLSFLGIFAKVRYAFLFTFIPCFILCLINYYKIKINGMPFVPSDFAFFKDAVDILGFSLPQIEISFSAVALVLLFAAFIFFIIKAEKFFTVSKKLRLYALATGLSLALIISLPITSGAISKVLGTDGKSPEELVRENGIVSGLYLSFAQNSNKHIIEVNKDMLGIKENQGTKIEKGKEPTVIFLMSESFFDAKRLTGVSFSEDPTPNFTKLSENYSSGLFISNTYCGGTGYVEMEVLTGLCNYLVNSSDNLTTLPEDAYPYMPCLSDIFENHGYTTAFLHSHTNALYNREYIYTSLGFDDIRFSKDFVTGPEYSGGYMSDSNLTKEIISVYENADKPLMLFAVSMENHQSYHPDKFEDESPIKVQSQNLNDEDIQIVESYIHGLYNADKALGELIDYFSKVEKPVVIAFFGDHLPNLNITDDKNAYREMGFSPEGETYEWKGEVLSKMLSTDYVIWDNMGLSKEDKTLGSTLFGFEITQRLGFELTDWFSYLDSNLKSNYTMYRPRLFMVDDKEIYSEIPEKYKNMMDTYTAAVYDIAYGGNTLFERHRQGSTEKD